MKKIYSISLAILLSLVGGSTIQAQRIWGNPIGQYSYNPAGACTSDLGEILASYYNIYAAANNNPQGFLLQGSTSFPTVDMGAGFRFARESGGVMTNLMAEATYVYKLNIGRNNKLAFGLSGTFNQSSVDKNIVNVQDVTDPLYIQAANAGYWFDINFGISFYKPNSYYIGIAAYDLIGAKTSWRLSNFTGRASRLLTVSGMYSYPFLEGDLLAEISAVGMCYIPQDEFTLTGDVTARLIYKKIGWLGAGYTNNMVKILAGFYIQNFAVGYSGGIGIGDIKDWTYAFPRHEVFLRLEFDTSHWSKKNN